MDQKCTPWPREESTSIHSFLIGQTISSIRWVAPQSKSCVLKERGINAGQANNSCPLQILAHEPSKKNQWAGSSLKNHSCSLLSVWFFFFFLPRSNFSADHCSPNAKVEMCLTLSCSRDRPSVHHADFCSSSHSHSLFLLILNSEHPPPQWLQP